MVKLRRFLRCAPMSYSPTSTLLKVKISIPSVAKGMENCTYDRGAAIETAKSDQRIYK